jgi:MFS family permease
MVTAFSSSVMVQRFGNKLVVAFGLAVVAIAMLLFGLLDVATPMWQVILISCVLGLGMGNVMAPATDSIMGSLPREKAGVGSAMNDTTRQVGGAVGVAVLGSILSSKYRSSVVHLSALQHFPAQLTTGIKDNVGQAIAVSHSTGAGALGGALAAVARRSYVDAFHVAVLVGAVVMLIAAACVLKWLPARAGDEAKVFTERPVHPEIELDPEPPAVPAAVFERS